jgi:hypothetical protein
MAGQHPLHVAGIHRLASREEVSAGAALTGTKAVIDEARVWQIRYGGRLFTAYHS